MTIEKKFARIENEETGECSVFNGTENSENIKWLVETCGMSLMEVEKSEDNKYYIVGRCPPPRQKDYKELRIENYPEIGEQLDRLYHDIDEGIFGESAKESKFYLTLKEVKLQFPKDNTEEK